VVLLVVVVVLSLVLETVLTLVQVLKQLGVGGGTDARAAVGAGGAGIVACCC